MKTKDNFSHEKAHIFKTQFEQNGFKAWIPNLDLKDSVCIQRSNRNILTTTNQLLLDLSRGNLGLHWGALYSKHQYIQWGGLKIENDAT